MAQNYTILEKKKTIVVDFEKATEKELETVKFLAQANGYKVTVSKPKAKVTKKKSLDNSFIEEYLKGDKEGTKNYIAAKKALSDKNNGKIKGFLGGKAYFIKNYPAVIDDKAIEKIANDKAQESFKNELATISDIEKQRKAYWKYYFK